MAINSGLTCGTQGCLGGASDVILKGYGGRGANLVVGFFNHQIRIAIKQVDRPGGAGGPIPVGPVPGPYNFPDEDRTNPDDVEVSIRLRWPFMEKHKVLKFIMKRSWANVVVNRINQINTYSETFRVKIQSMKADFTVKYDQLRDKLKK